MPTKNGRRELYDRVQMKTESERGNHLPTSEVLVPCGGRCSRRDLLTWELLSRPFFNW